MTKLHIKAQIKSYALTGTITFLTVLAIFMIKGIWPFGTNRIDYFDNMQQVAPLYTHLWDWMHGKASLWFDWYTGLGTNVSMSISAFSMLSPFNLLLYLVPRNLILESFSLLTVVKMVFMAVAMNIYLDKKTSTLNKYIRMFFSISYAFCGYTFLYASCFTPWMDIVALFPLFMLAYEYMIETGKKRFYIMMVALLFIINYYLSAMSILYIFLISGIYMLFLCEKGKWKAHAYNLGIGTFAGIGLSAFVLVPVIFQLGSSQRTSFNTNILNQYMGWVSSSILSDRSLGALQRYMMVYGMAFVIALIVIGLKRFWHDKPIRNYYGTLTLFVVLPIFVEGINLMWHFGSYNGYTMRNGFLIAFTLISSGAYFAQRFCVQCVIDKRKLAREALAAIVLAVIYVVIYQIMPDNNEIIALCFFLVIFAALLTAYVRKLHDEAEHFNFGQVIVVMALEIFVAVYAFTGVPKFYRCAPYQIGDYVQLANAVYEDLDIEESVTDRIVNPDISLNANYPLILQRSALSSFTAALQSDTQGYAKKLGYSKYFLWLLDSGGTVFTNTLFHVTQAVNVNALDKNFYTPVRTSGDYTLYDANYTLPFAVSVNNAVAYEDYDGSWVDLHNKLYTAITHDTTALVSGMGYIKKESDAIREYKVQIEGNKALYISVADINNKDGDANNSWLMNAIHLYINDEPVLIPTLGDVKNTAYFTDYNNNLVYLGCFQDEEISIRIEYDDPWYLKVSEVVFAGIDMDKMQSMVTMHENDYCETSYTPDSLTIKLRGTGLNNMALIPVVYSDNWNITVDGRQVKGKAICGLFTGVQIHSGENTINMTFEPKGKKEGMLITIIMGILVLFGLIVNHFNRVKIPAVFQYIALFIYLELYNAVIVLMFLIPSIAAIPAFIYHLVRMLL